MGRESKNLKGKRERWFVAELVIKITVEGDRRVVAHRNSLLVEARSEEQAYTKALNFGRGNEISYRNPAGKMVDIRFLGLSELSAVNDRLEDGAELSYREYVDTPDEVIKSWVPPKARLTVFTDITPSPGPDYRSAEVLEEIVKKIPYKRS